MRSGTFSGLRQSIKAVSMCWHDGMMAFRNMQAEFRSSMNDYVQQVSGTKSYARAQILFGEGARGFSVDVGKLFLFFEQYSEPADHVLIADYLGRLRVDSKALSWIFPHNRLERLDVTVVYRAPVGDAVECYQQFISSREGSAALCSIQSNRMVSEDSNNIAADKLSGLIQRYGLSYERMGSSRIDIRYPRMHNGTVEDLNSSKLPVLDTHVFSEEDFQRFEHMCSTYRHVIKSSAGDVLICLECDASGYDFWSARKESCDCRVVIRLPKLCYNSVQPDDEEWLSVCTAVTMALDTVAEFIQERTTRRNK